MLGSLSLQEMEDLLKRNVTGRIGCYDGERVYIIPVSYAYNEGAIIVHSQEGMKIDIMRKNPNVCFEVDEMQDLSNWNSVIGWGTYEEITDEKERYYMMKFLMGRLVHMAVSETAGLPQTEGQYGYRPDVIRPVVYRIKITEKTGRFEHRSL